MRQQVNLRGSRENRFTRRRGGAEGSQSEESVRSPRAEDGADDANLETEVAHLVLK